MLESIEITPTVKDAVLYHHENYDGTGYPGKLAGEEVPLLARIIRVADSFRALISHRPYQRKYTVGEAVDVLKHRSGTFFDPKIVGVFADVVLKRAGDFARPSEPVRKRDTVGQLSGNDVPSNSQGGD